MCSQHETPLLKPLIQFIIRYIVQQHTCYCHWCSQEAINEKLFRLFSVSYLCLCYSVIYIYIYFFQARKNTEQITLFDIRSNRLPFWEYRLPSSIYMYYKLRTRCRKVIKQTVQIGALTNSGNPEPVLRFMTEKDEISGLVKTVVPFIVAQQIVASIHE